MFSSTNSPFPPYYFPSSSYPPPSLPPPPLPPSIVNQEPNSSCVENNIFLYQNHHFDHQIPLSTHPFFFSTNTNNNNSSSSSSSIPQILIPETLINLGVSNSSNTTTTTTPTPTMTINKGQDSHATSGTGLDFSGLGQNFLIKKASKKDRHSKIYTAQGLRDRRVRLSIEIAREFFDLHDMLGFDKASKTLEWLLTKSKKAIKEVSRSKHYSNYRSSKMSLSNSTTSECEEAAVSEVNEAVEPLSTPPPPHHHHHHKDHHQDLVVGAKPRDEEMVSSKNIDLEKLMLSSSSSSSGLAAAKDSRAMARARARARTKEKRYYYNNHCTSNTTKRSSTTTTTTSSGISTAPCLINSSQILNQFKSPNFTSETTVPTLGLDDDHHDDRNESSAVIKWSKLTLFPGPMNTTPTSSSTTYGHHHHHHRHEEEHLCGISKGESNSSDNIYSPMITLLTQNWDMNGTTATTTTTTHGSGRPVGFRLPIT